MKSLPEIIDEKDAIGKIFLGSLPGSSYSVHEQEAGSRTWSRSSFKEAIKEELCNLGERNFLITDTKYVSAREYQIARGTDVTTYLRVLMFFRDGQEDKTK